MVHANQVTSISRFYHLLARTYAQTDGRTDGHRQTRTHFVQHRAVVQHITGAHSAQVKRNR